MSFNPTADRKHPARLTVKRDSAAALVLLERRRQVDSLGYTPEADDKNQCEELAQASAYYASPDADAGLWPATWDLKFQKRLGKTRIQQLTVAAALAIAEIERLQRLETELDNDD